MSILFWLIALSALIFPVAAIFVGLSDSDTALRNYFLLGTLAMCALTVWLAIAVSILDAALGFVLSLALLAVCVHLHRFAKEESRTSSA